MTRLAPLLLAFGLCAWMGCAEGDAGRPPSPVVPDSAKIRAVTLDARHPPEADLLPHLRALGATHVTLIPFGFQPRPDAPTIRMHTDGDWYSESDAGIHAIAHQARTHELGLILKPHIWIGDYSADGQDRNAIAFDTEADWQQWEDDYRTFLLHYARLADTTGADVLVIGTELDGVATARPRFWRALIDTIRAVYDGKLTYAANWNDQYRDVPFWDALDFVGVQAYFPLSDDADPSPEALRAGWDAHRAALRRVAATTGRPVLFTEMGYRSVSYAAAMPWKWPERDEPAPPAFDVQARLYWVFFDRVMPQPWLAGVMLWKWHPADESRRPLGFTPQDKPAERIIRRGFSALP